MADIEYFVHPTSVVDEGSLVGKGTRIWHWSHVMGGAVIGESCNVGEHSFVESGVVIGNRVTIKNNVALYSGVQCEDDVFLGPNCVFTNVYNPRSFVSRKNEFLRTLVKKGATIGANATIVCGNTIGEYAMVGSGSVVTKDVPPYALVYGNPARQHGWVCKCGEILRGSNRCPRCGEEYTH